MDLEDDGSPARRRRGEELEHALLDAAWAEVAENGYGSFTFEAVAERAGTSRPVLARRWKTREELVVAAIRHDSEKNRPHLPDTGSLRGDVIALLETVNDTRLRAASVIMIQLGSYFQETGTAPSDLRQQILLGGRQLSMETIIRRSVERGEIPDLPLAPRVVALPFDLARQEVLMTFKPLSKRTIVEIVDDIFLPLVTRPLD